MEHYISNEFWCIYYHKNKTNGKIYLDQSNNTVRRFGKNGSGYKGCSYFWNAIQKYGWDNFEHIILIKDLSKDCVDIIEQVLIEKYSLRDHHFGYNIAVGGMGGPGLIGENHPKSKPIYRYSLSGIYMDEWINIQEVSKKLKINAGNISRSASSNGKRSAGGFLWSHNKQDKIESNIVLPGQNARKEYPRIYRVDFNGNIEKKYDDIHHIEDYSIQQCYYILECCKGNQLSSFDSFWMFEDDYSEQTVNELIEKKFNNTEKQHKTRMICMYDLHGKYIDRFLSKSDAAKHTNIKDYIIYSACLNSNGTHRGNDYLWYFYDETHGKDVAPYFKKHKTTPVYQYCQDGTFFAAYDQLKFAKQKYGSSIKRALQSKSHYSNGYLWFYQSDYLKYKSQFNLKDPNIESQKEV